jgi:DNA-binding transcriptional regulator YhcF (GntR family)
MDNNIVKDISIDPNSVETKLQQLINELLRIIQTRCSQGDVLPSVNTLSKELNISRDTVFKAYSELKNRNLVGSNPTKGYFVNHDINKVLLLLDYYSPFKDVVYREFEKNLDESYSIDLVFHHYNKKLFDTVILESIGRYNTWIVMNFDTQKFELSGILSKIDPAKLLLIDIPVEQWKGFDKEKCNYIWQDFDEAVYHAFQNISEKICKYKVFHFLNPDKIKQPASTIKAYKKFCADSNIKSNIIRSSRDLNVLKGDAYFILRQMDLYIILSQCKEKNLEVGKDVGILAYNDIPLYEFVSCGITVISTDFKKMGLLASQFVKGQLRLKETLPTRTIIRNSL